MGTRTTLVAVALTIAGVSIAHAGAVARAPVHLLFAELDARLARDTRIDRVTVEGDTLVVQGQSADVDAIVAALDASPLIETTARVAPDVVDVRSRKQQFVVSARIVAPTTIPAHAAIDHAAFGQRLDRVLAADAAHGCERRQDVARADAMRVRLRCTPEAVPQLVASLESADPPLALDWFQTFRYGSNDVTGWGDWLGVEVGMRVGGADRAGAAGAGSETP